MVWQACRCFRTMPYVVFSRIRYKCFAAVISGGREAVLHDTRKSNHVARLGETLGRSASASEGIRDAGLHLPGKLLVHPRSAAVSPANCRPRRDWWDLEIRTRHGALSAPDLAFEITFKPGQLPRRLWRSLPRHSCAGTLARRC